MAWAGLVLEPRQLNRGWWMWRHHQDLLSTCQTDWIFQSSTKPDLLWRITCRALKVQMKSKWLQAEHSQPPTLRLHHHRGEDQQSIPICNWSLRDRYEGVETQSETVPHTGSVETETNLPSSRRQQEYFSHKSQNKISPRCLPVGVVGDNLLCKWNKMPGIWRPSR